MSNRRKIKPHHGADLAAQRARVAAELAEGLAERCGVEGCEQTGAVEVERADGLSAWLCVPDAAEHIPHMAAAGDLVSVSVIGPGDDVPEMPGPVTAALESTGMIDRVTAEGTMPPTGYVLLTVHLKAV